MNNYKRTKNGFGPYIDSKIVDGASRKIKNDEKIQVTYLQEKWTPLSFEELFKIKQKDGGTVP